MPDKYITFKRDEYDRWWDSRLPQDVPHLAELALDDVVVIRLQDRFSAPALFTYSSTVRTAAEVMAEAGVDEFTVKQINSIADYFAEQGIKAAETPGKLPD